MRAPSDFTDFRKKVDMMLDKALTKEAEEEVMNRIKDNPAYEQMLNNERNFRDFVRGNVVRPKVTPEFIQSIKDKVRIQH
ncbi:MAG: hypothetical protein KDC53_12675 [Saprospiraceae bacterium]|nr:hypothetical protein [Saprospiraceae bacterium]